jgi:transposase-like protein
MKARSMSSEEQIQFLEEGLIYCPSCNRSKHIELIYVTTAIDRRVADVETSNIYPVSLVKCHDCGFDFELERVDPRRLTAITEEGE